MRLLVTFMISSMAGAAYAGAITPRSDAPDVVYIGEGWPADLTNGCFDRGECKLPETTAGTRTPPAGRSVFGIGVGSGCSGALQAGGDVSAAFASVARCLNGG